MSPQFQSVHLPPQWPIADQFPQHLYCLKFLSVWCLFCLGVLWNAECVLPTTQLTYKKGLGTCDALLCVAHTLQSTLELVPEAKMVQIDFSAAFDMVKHQRILFKLCSVEVGGSVLSVLTQFLSNRSQYVVVDGSRCKLVNMVSGVPHRSILSPQLYIMELFSVVENKLYGYADDSTLVAVVPSPAEIMVVTESMNRDLNRVIVWYDQWRMKLNAGETKTMIVSRSCTVHPQLTPLTLGGTVLNESAELFWSATLPIVDRWQCYACCLR